MILGPPIRAAGVFRSFGNAVQLPWSTLTGLVAILYLVVSPIDLRGGALNPAGVADVCVLPCLPVCRFAGPARWLPHSSLLQETWNVASIEERVVDIVAEQLGVDKEKVKRETSFVNDLGADSLDQVELVMELEEEFDLDIPDDAAEKIQTVGQAIEFIEQHQE